MNPQEISVGVVGLGLMGCSITTCLLIAGHPVVAVAPVSVDLVHAEGRIRNHLKHSFENGVIGNDPEFYLDQLAVTEDYAELSGCKLVIECTLENIAIKESVF